MQSLRELQRGFTRALFAPGAMQGDDAAGRVPEIRADGISPTVRLGFYRTNVFENYRKALRLTYPCIERLVGPGFFGRLAGEYTRDFPSRSGDVGTHGNRFAEFLSTHPCSRELPYLADVARLEWYVEESFNEADHAALSLARLVAVPAAQCERLCFLLAPSCRLLSSSFPLQRIWQVCQPEYQGEIDVDLSSGGVDLLVRRDAHAIAVERLGPGEFAMLVALFRGYAFGEALEHASAVADEFDPVGFLQRHVLSGTLVDFNFREQSFSGA